MDTSQNKPYILEKTWSNSTVDRFLWFLSRGHRAVCFMMHAPAKCCGLKTRAEKGCSLHPCFFLAVCCRGTVRTLGCHDAACLASLKMQKHRKLPAAEHKSQRFGNQLSSRIIQLPLQLSQALLIHGPAVTQSLQSAGKVLRPEFTYNFLCQANLTEAPIKTKIAVKRLFA